MDAVSIGITVTTSPSHTVGYMLLPGARNFILLPSVNRLAINSGKILEPLTQAEFRSVSGALRLMSVSLDERFAWVSRKLSDFKFKIRFAYVLRLKLFISAVVLRYIIIAFFRIWIASFSLNSFRLLKISVKVKTSKRQPNAIYKNCINSLLYCRPFPSAIFWEIPYTADSIWPITLKCLLGGNDSRRPITKSARSTDNCHTSIFSKGNTKLSSSIEYSIFYLLKVWKTAPQTKCS